MLKTWLFQLIQQRPDLTKVVCEWFAEPNITFSYLNNARMIWNEFRSTLKYEKAGITYCIAEGLHEMDEQNLKIAMELFEGRFPREGCLENVPKLQILIVSRDRISSNEFGHIDFRQRSEDKTLASFEECKIETTDQLMDSIAGFHQTFHRKILETVAAFRQPPKIKQLAWALGESAEVLGKRMQLCRTFLGDLTDNRICFLSSDVWHVFATSDNSPEIHLELSRKCLEIISQDLTQIDMEVLENERSSWLSILPMNLFYAILFWTEHVTLSRHLSSQLFDHIMTVFSPTSTIIEKWWLVYMSEVCRIPRDAISQCHNTTVLHVLAYFGFHDMLKIARNSEHWHQLQDCLDTHDCMDMTPLALALLQNESEVVQILVAAGAKITCEHLLYAAESNAALASHVFHHYAGEPLVRTQMVKLVQRSVASCSEKLVSLTIQFIMSNGDKNVLPWDETEAFIHAIELGQDRLIKHLIKITDLEVTIERVIELTVASHEEVILATILRKPEIRSVISREKLTLLTPLLQALEWRCPLMVNTLLNMSNIDLKHDNGHTPLQVAARYANKQTLCQFLHYPSFQFSGRSVEEGVALNLVLHQDRIDLKEPLINLKQMLERGARMQYGHFGITAFHVAAEIGRTEVMEVLLEKLSKTEIKADINLQPSSRHSPQWNDTTALAIAARNGSIGIVRLLLLHGADINIKDGNGKTALQLAHEQGHAEVAEMLEQVEKGGLAVFKKRTHEKTEATDTAVHGDGFEELDDQEPKHGRGKDKRGKKKSKTKGKGRA